MCAVASPLWLRIWALPYAWPSRRRDQEPCPRAESRSCAGAAAGPRAPAELKRSAGACAPAGAAREIGSRGGPDPPPSRAIFRRMQADAREAGARLHRREAALGSGGYGAGTLEPAHLRDLHRRGARSTRATVALPSTSPATSTCRGFSAMRKDRPLSMLSARAMRRGRLGLIRLALRSSGHDLAGLCGRGSRQKQRTVIGRLSGLHCADAHRPGGFTYLSRRAALPIARFMATDHGSAFRAGLR